VAPDDPLSMGLVDRLNAVGIPAFGPTAAAARIESSKAFAKEVMARAGIPTAAYRTFDDAAQARAYAETCALPIVVKADGLALGKGVLICSTRDDVQNAVEQTMCSRAFGSAGSRIVIEEFMTGPEMTLLAFCDGKTVLPMVTAQDYKRAHDGDLGLNTGGMGSVSPALHEQPGDVDFCVRQVLQPCVDELARMGCPFQGVLYAGLMRTPGGIRVIEFNARFGDPEAQAVLSRLETDLLTVLLAATQGRLNEITLTWKNKSSVCVVMASGGYPGKIQTGFAISGLSDVGEATVYHAGTALREGQVVTAGGRVLGVTALGESVAQARESAYAEAAKLHFEHQHMRRDIAQGGHAT